MGEVGYNPRVVELGEELGFPREPLQVALLYAPSVQELERYLATA